MLIANDPYDTGTHVSDTSVYVPVFHAGELVAFAISTAHWADIGAKAPGGWCPDRTDVYQEGVCFSHQKLLVGGSAAIATSGTSSPATSGFPKPCSATSRPRSPPAVWGPPGFRRSAPSTA